jgi:polysaccharide export outer membrane protein
MTKNKKLLILSLSVLLFSLIAPGFVSAQISSSEISQYEQMARDQGLSQSEIELARQKYSNSNQAPNQNIRINPQSQIQRFGDDDSIGINNSSNTDDNLSKYENSDKYNNFSLRDSLRVNDTTLSRKYDTLKTDTAKILSYFGYDIFKNVPDAFKPNAVGPVDPGYLVGPGDVLRLTVWGQAEFQYELTVNKEGKIFIPVAGQVYVTGVPFDQLQTKIKALLSRNYSGLTSVPQRTFMDLTVARIRPVRIFVMGEVKQPGGYTVSSFATVFNALYSIGGPLQGGSLRNVKVIRNGKEIANVDIYAYLLGGKCTSDIRLQNDDVVFVPPRGKTVAVTGSLFRPAYYELNDSDQLSSLLNYCGGVSSLTNLDNAQLFRVLPFDKRDGAAVLSRITDINLRDYILQKKEFSLYDKDSICFMPLYSDLKDTVKLTGAVMYPGLYQSDTTTLSQLIFKIGKVIEEKYYPVRADIFRLNPDLVTKQVIPVDLERLRTDPSYDRKLAPGDEVVVYDKNVEKPFDLQIKVDGEVNKPGIYNLSTNMTVIDALIKAGGFNRKAYKKTVSIIRADRTGSDTLCNVFKFDLPDSFSYLDDKLRNFQLEDRDRIVVRVDPDYNEIEIVKVMGKVKFQGVYSLNSRSVRLVDIIDRAGGLMPDAFLDGAFVSRGGKRVVVNFEKAYYQKKEKENILLQPNDSVYIPGKPNTVSVFGNVNNPGLLSFVDNDRVSNYLGRAGGLADSTQSVLVTYPNGETRKIGKHSRGPKVPDGSKIYVTKKPYVSDANKKQGPTIMEVVRDTLAIITSAVTVIALAVKL